MVDVVDSATRSRIMSGMRGQNTKPEILIRNLPGKPDIVLLRYHAVIFVHGCFWHGHDCQQFKWPGTRPNFWRDKIGRNRANYHKANEALLASGWWVTIIWESAIRGARKNIEGVALSLADWLRRSALFIEERG